MDEIAYEPLPREEVIKAVERRGPRRVPMAFAKWWGQGLPEQYGDRLKEFDRFPEDIVPAGTYGLAPGEMNLPWYDSTAPKTTHDSRGALPDWKYLDEFLRHMPSPDAPARLDPLHETARKAHADNRYLVFGWWFCMFERPWNLRGMENLMLDYYDHPREVHRLHEALCDYYVGLIRRAGKELRPDAFWTSDDVGNQRQLMMRPAHFREYIKPYFKRIASACHENNMHFWLHSCGNITEIMDDLIEVGLNAIHPIQKHTMDERDVAKRFGDRITFWAGVDVQHILQEGSPQDVRKEVRTLIDTFDRPEGGMVLAAGNGIVGGTPLPNIEAFLDEGLKYGRKHREMFGR